MAQVAFFTFGVLCEAVAHPKNQNFFPLVPEAFEAAKSSKGFVGIAQLLNKDEIPSNVDQHDCGAWGKRKTPRFYQGSMDVAEHTALQTLTLWSDLQSVYNFAYQGLHLNALRRRREWFIHGEWPTYVSWWVVDGETPTWEQACKRLEHLHDYGPSAYAFNFKHPFGPDGEPTQFRNGL